MRSHALGDGTVILLPWSAYDNPHLKVVSASALDDETWGDSDIPYAKRALALLSWLEEMGISYSRAIVLISTWIGARTLMGESRVMAVRISKDDEAIVMLRWR